MQITLTDRQVHAFRIVCIAALLLAAGSYVLFTIHWPWLWDTQVMHYVTLLLRHGKVPYKDIYDLNMPGAYLVESWAIDLFGGGDLGWRLYEFTLLGVMTLAMMVIAMPYDWLAGLFAGVLFTLLHGTEGPYNAVQRDEVLTVLLLVGYALLFLAVRKREPRLMLAFGFAVGLATTIKPTVVPFALLLLLFPVVALETSRRLQSAVYLACGLTGMVAALAMVDVAIMRHGALGAFFEMNRRLLPYYASLNRPSWSYMVRRSLPSTFLLYAPVALLLALVNKERVSKEAMWEMWAIRLGFLFGAFSYFIQRKGYTYHRYSYLAFALLWVGIEFTSAMRRRGWTRTVGVAAMAFCVFLMLPFNAWKIYHRTYTNGFADTLTGDLERLGGAQLQNRVQCLDVVSGCLTALYRLDLVQSTGFTGDLQFFAPDDGNVVPSFRRLFLDGIQRDPPRVIVLSDQWFTAETYSFDLLNAWPELRDYLATAYTLDVTRDIGEFEGNDVAYRIYVLKDAKVSLDKSSF